MPWGSWVTCEETVNGPDVGAGLHGRPQRRADEAARLDLRGAGERRPARASRPASRSARPAASPTRPSPTTRTRTTSTSPRTTSASRPASTATRRRRTRCAPGAWTTAGRCRCSPSATSRTPTSPPANRATPCTACGGSTSPSPIPSTRTHPAQPAPTTNNDAIQYVGLQGLDQGAAQVLAPRGLRLRPRRRLLLLDPGRRSAGARRQRHRRGLGQRDRADLGVPHAPELLRLVYESPGPRRWTSRTTSRPASAARSCCARTTSTTTTCAA